MQPKLTPRDLEVIARHYYNGQTTARQLIRSPGYAALSTAILGCRTRNFLWLHDELDKELDEIQERRAAVADAVYERKPLLDLVRTYGADLIADDLAALRGTQYSVRQLIYPDPAAAHAAAAQLAIEEVQHA